MEEVTELVTRATSSPVSARSSEEPRKPPSASLLSGREVDARVRPGPPSLAKEG